MLHQIRDSLLIENGTVLTAGKTPAVLPHHSVLIEGGFITRIAPKQSFKHFAGKRLDATRKIVMPGLINAHTHLYSTFARGLTKAKPSGSFQEVLKNLWWRLDSALTKEDCYYSALIALLESIRHGTTTLIDHHASPNAVRGSLRAIGRAVQATGLRACLCYEVSDRDGRRIATQGLEENADFIRHAQAGGGGRKGEDGGWRMDNGQWKTEVQDKKGDVAFAQASLVDPRPRTAALFGLHASFTLKDATLAKAATLARGLQTGFHIHVAEDASDQQHAVDHFGIRVVERLEKFGILGPQTIAAHCVHVNRKELDLLAETGTAVVHNPQSNLNNAVGVADIIAMSRKDILLGLGTDAMTANLLEEARVALWSQHLRAKNPSAAFPEVVAALVANNPRLARRVFNLPLGELREGCVADIVVMDYDPPTPLEAGNYYGQLIFGLSQASVDTTIVGGRVLMENRRLTLDLDEPRINARARELAAKLWKRL